MKLTEDLKDKIKEYFDSKTKEELKEIWENCAEDVKGGLKVVDYLKSKGRESDLYENTGILKNIINIKSRKMELKLNLEDMCLIGRHGDFGRAVDPLNDELSKVMIGVDSGLYENTCVDLDGDFQIIEIYQLQDNTTDEDIRSFINENIQDVVDKVREEISNMISNYY